MIFISYFTKNTPYEEIAKTKLIPTLKKWYLRYNVEGIDDLGSWKANTHFKAEFIKKMLLKFKQPVVFTDVDVTIEKYPELFFKLKNYDIGLHFLDWYKFWRGQEGQSKREALSGTLYLNYNEKVLKFLDDWIAENKRSTNWEQRNMQKILAKWKNKLQIAELPIQYIAIVKFDNKVPNFIKEPVIIHWQASRKYKNRK